MREIETDYLVVGAGACGMAFVDALIAQSDAEVVMVDRRHRPGGHWLDAYPFVRLHQPSPIYGVNSRTLGTNRIDEFGPNAGYYERATAAEICDYFGRVLDEQFLPSGRVGFLGTTDYLGEDGTGHHVASRLTNEETIVKVHRKLVDCRYTQPAIPSTHSPAFEVDAGVRVIPPNDLVDLETSPSGYTVLGAGKTAIDTCVWLLEGGVDPDRIRWVRPRDAWTWNRACVRPLELVGAYMDFQARWIQTAAEAESVTDFAHRAEAAEVFYRIDTSVEPEVFRGPFLSAVELESVRQIENVIRLGRVLRIGSDRLTLERDSIGSDPREVYVDCTAAGVPPFPARPIFGADRITVQYVIPGASMSAATLGTVEALRDDDDEKNRLCSPMVPIELVTDIPRFVLHVMTATMVRSAEPDLAAWSEASRLNPARGAADHMDDPRIPAAFASISANIGPAMRNIERLVISR